VCCRKALGVIGREVKGVEGLCADRGEAAVGEGGVGVDVAVRFRYGTASLVEEKFCNPSSRRGALGLSGD
jgi:hypothetical protein